jgi:hypothetical protein
MIDNVVTIAESEVGRVIGKPPMPRIDSALRHTPGL